MATESGAAHTVPKISKIPKYNMKSSEKIMATGEEQLAFLKIILNSEK